MSPSGVRPPGRSGSPQAVDEIEDFRAALGYGIGARWSSPIGSLNLDLAYGEEVNEWRVHFSVGIVLR